MPGGVRPVAGIARGALPRRLGIIRGMQFEAITPPGLWLVLHHLTLTLSSPAIRARRTQHPRAARRVHTPMASTNMASATSRFMLAAGVPTAGSGSGSSGRVSFAPAPNQLGRRLVVRADPEAPAEPAEGEGAVATKPKAEKPPPIGPKRGTKVHSHAADF